MSFLHSPKLINLYEHSIYKFKTIKIAQNNSREFHCIKIEILPTISL